MLAPDTSTPTIVALDAASFEASLDRLAAILAACVREGAGIGFVLPFSEEDARGWWRGAVEPAVATGARVVLTAQADGAIVGTAQLDLDRMPSKRHHAEVSKVLVDPRRRRMGVARALMEEIERRADDDGRWLLTLDTSGEEAETLYRSLGYAFGGEIPNYARNALDPDRTDATRIFYKDLRAALPRASGGLR